MGVKYVTLPKSKLDLDLDKELIEELIEMADKRETTLNELCEDALYFYKKAMRKKEGKK